MSFRTFLAPPSVLSPAARPFHPPKAKAREPGTGDPYACMRSIISRAENGCKLFIDNYLRRNGVMHVMQFMHESRMLVTRMPKSPTAENGAVAFETIVHIDGLVMRD